MNKYKKKPVVIEAVQLTKYNIIEVYEWVYNQRVMPLTMASLDRWDRYCDGVIENGMDIPTLEDGKDLRAKHVATIGDYVIKGIAGEFYPCKPEIFIGSYEPHE